MTSLRVRLLASLLTVVVLVGAAGAWLTYRNALVVSATFFDYQLRQTALLVREQLTQFPLPPAARSTRSSYDFVVQIWSLEGVSMFLSRPYEVVPGIARDGFSTVEAGGNQWRVFALRTRDGIVQVAQPMRVRAALAREAALRSLPPFLVLLPLLAFLIWLTVGRALRPVQELTRSVAGRPPLLLEPLPEENLPNELRPLIRAMNALLDRLRAAVDHERAFLADAAHELRTPLAALALQVDAIRATPEGAHAQGIDQLARGVQRASRLVEQLLALAREDDPSPRPTVAVSLDTLAREAVAETLPAADERGVDLGVVHADPVSVNGDPAALHALVRNLVDNAVRYTPRGGRVDLAVRAQGSGNDRSATLEVADNGPGIPAAERERVFERFYRIGGADEPGSGLGLAIVRAVASSHGAQVKLEDGPDGRGLRVRVEFPSALP